MSSGLGVPEEDEKGYMQMSSPRSQSTTSQRSPTSPLPSPRRPPKPFDSGGMNLSSSRANLLDVVGSDRRMSDPPEPYFTSQVQAMDPQPYASSTDVKPKTVTEHESDVSMKLRVDSNASVRYSSNPAQSDGRLGHEYTMIAPNMEQTSTRTNSVKRADSILYGNRISHHKEIENHTHSVTTLPKSRGRSAVILLAFLGVVSTCALGLAVFLLLRKSDDCSCSSQTSGTAKQTQDVSNLQQRILELENMVAMLNGSGVANSQNINSINISLNTKFQETQQIIRMSAGNLQTNIESLNTSCSLKSSDFSVQLEQQMTAITLLEANQTQSMNGLDNIGEKVANVSTAARAAAVQYSYANAANAAARAGYLFDNCTTQSFTCGFTALSNGSRDPCVNQDVLTPPAGWRLLSVTCEADGQHSNQIITVLRKYTPTNPNEPGVFCQCAFDGSPNIVRGSKGFCISRAYICRTSSQ